MSSHNTNLLRDHKSHGYCPEMYFFKAHPKSKPCCCSGHPCQTTKDLVKLDSTGSIEANMVEARKKYQAKKVK